MPLLLDFRGNAVEVGAAIAYAVRGGSWMELKDGVVTMVECRGPRYGYPNAPLEWRVRVRRDDGTHVTLTQPRNLVVLRASAPDPGPGGVPR